MRLLRLSAEMESRAVSLRVEALQCMTIALAGTDTKHFWDTMTTFFGAASDKEDVWDFVDPVSRVARPLDLESTDDEEEEDARILEPLLLPQVPPKLRPLHVLL